MRLTQLFHLLSSLPTLVRALDWQIGNSCPESIKTTIPGGSYSEDKYGFGQNKKKELPRFESMHSVHSALSTCPNITSLDLRVTLLGCSSWPDRWNFPFKLEGGDAYPPLKGLRLEGYDFSESAWRNAQLKTYEGSWGEPWYQRMFDWWGSGRMAEYYRYRKLPEEQRNKTNLELWLDAMDWSHIEKLGALDARGRGQYHFLDKLAGQRLASLKELEIWGAENNTVAFVTSLEPNSLTSFTWVDGWDGPEEPLDPILEHHGPSLRHLDIHSHESMQRASPALSTAQLQSLVNKTPNLIHLILNVPRNGTWPLEVFDILASSSSVETLELYFDITSECQRQKPKDYMTDYLLSERGYRDRNQSLPCQKEERFQQPFLSEAASLQNFKYMRSRKVGRELKTVTFWAGDWSRGWDGPLYSPPWIEGRRVKVACTTEGKVEGEAWCSAEQGEGYWLRDGYPYEYDDYY